MNFTLKVEPPTSQVDEEAPRVIFETTHSSGLQCLIFVEARQTDAESLFIDVRLSSFCCGSFITSFAHNNKYFTQCSTCQAMLDLLPVDRAVDWGEWENREFYGGAGEIQQWWMAWLTSHLDPFSAALHAQDFDCLVPALLLKELQALPDFMHLQAVRAGLPGLGVPLEGSS